MRIQAAHGDARPRDAPQPLHVGMHDPERGVEQRVRDGRLHEGATFAGGHLGEATAGSDLKLYIVQLRVKQRSHGRDVVFHGNNIYLF